MGEDWTKRRDELFRQLHVGDQVTGTVSGLASYGASWTSAELTV